LPKELNNTVCDDRVFEHLYTKYAKDLNAFLYYKYGDHLNPSDKVQDAFVTLWNHCKKVPLSKAKSYLFTVANNMMLNEIKHQKVVLKYQQHTTDTLIHETPEFILEQEEYLKRYQSALAGLKDEQRVAFLLNKVEGKKHSEIAEQLGVTKKVVEYRIYSAFTQLKKELEGFILK